MPDPLRPIRELPEFRPANQQSSLGQRGRVFPAPPVRTAYYLTLKTSFTGIKAQKRLNNNLNLSLFSKDSHTHLTQPTPRLHSRTNPMSFSTCSMLSRRMPSCERNVLMRCRISSWL